MHIHGNEILPVKLTTVRTCMECNGRKNGEESTQVGNDAKTGERRHSSKYSSILYICTPKGYGCKVI